MKSGGVLLFAALAVLATPVAGEDEFPIAGTYTRDIACTGNGSDRPDLLVRITRQRIESQLGTCAILNHKRAGKTIQAHVECKIGGGQPLLGDVTFTMRDGSTLDFEDQDHTSDATLYKCAN
jgi:hypothetical protein